MSIQITADNLLTRQEAADLLRVSLSTISRLLKTGDLYYLKLERRVLIPKESLDAYVRGERIVPSGNPLMQPNPATWPPTGSLFSDVQEG